MAAASRRPVWMVSAAAALARQLRPPAPRQLPLLLQLSVQQRSITFQTAFLHSSCGLCCSSPSPPSSSSVASALTVRYTHGLPCLTVPLPSRGESCVFTLRPLTDSVSSFCDQLRVEDRGIDLAAIFDQEDSRVSGATPVEHLLQRGRFRLRINDRFFDVCVERPPEQNTESVRRLDELRETVAALHAALCIDEYKVARECRLKTMLDEAERQLEPLEEEKNRIAAECDAHSHRMMWMLFAMMGVQTGLFARLTWWEYSWDIMEPVTYFSTYATVVASAAYYLHTKQPFDYPLAQSRIFTRSFYKRAAAANFDVDRYFKLTQKVERLRVELRRLRDPLFQHLPVSQLASLDEQLIEGGAEALLSSLKKNTPSRPSNPLP